MVEEQFGVSPSAVIDVLALWGDSSDNIPGVPGIGEKTSKELIRQFHSIENMLKHLNQISKTPLQEKIQANLEQLELSKQLVTIEKNLDIDFNLNDFTVSEPEYDTLIPLLQELEFSSLLS